jgi:predicted nucleotidyltransferase component of viral defense system
MITKQQLQLINRRTLKYPLDVAEKDYFLAQAVKLISESSLDDVLVFKGGTAIHHCYLPQHRFSEDLDFTSLEQSLDTDTVVDVLESTGEFEVKKQFESPATIKIERLRYQGVLDQPGAIKVEIDRKQNVVLPPVEQTYTNVWGVEAQVQTMDLQEITAEKIRATATRVRYRDFYDLCLIVEQTDVDLGQAVELLKQKEIRRTVGPDQIRENWQEARKQLAGELDSIRFTHQVSNEDIDKLLNQLQFAPVIRQEP